jgi:ATP-dependent helicase Lhr and Lhr-like helicase
VVGHTDGQRLTIGMVDGTRTEPVRLNLITSPDRRATERLHAEAMMLLQRHGVLTREAVVGEGWPGGFNPCLYPVLRAMEEARKARRGCFVDGLGGSQFALPGAVDRLRAARDAARAVVALAATHPALGRGAALAGRRPGGRTHGPRGGRVRGA